MMSHVKAALFGRPRAAAAGAGFHSTTVLERKRKTQWHYRFNYYAKRRRNREPKRTFLRNMSEYAEYLFQSWRDEEERSASSGPSWFRGHRWVRGTKRNDFHSHEFYSGQYRSSGRGGFNFCTSDDDDDPETVFRNAFGGNQQFYWSFDSGSFQWRNSRRAYSESSRNWSYETDDEDDISTQSDVETSARQALGLNVSGPLKLEEVKSAYRACALKWHPDRHHGSLKVAAEEKFKHCSAAYQTLCDSLATG